MAEKIIENQMCRACGADIRKNALFCYNCGKSVVPEIVNSAEKDENSIVPEDVFFENENKILRSKIDDKPENSAALRQALTSESVLKPQVKTETTLKSAASLRKINKTVPEKKVEIIWRENENAPNRMFIFAVILLTLFAAVVLWLELYF